MGEWLKGREVQGEGRGKREWKVVVRIRCVGLTVCVWVGRTAVCGCDLKKGIRVSSYETFRDYSRCVRARPLQAVKAAVTETKTNKGGRKRRVQR